MSGSYHGAIASAGGEPSPLGAGAPNVVTTPANPYIGGPDLPDESGKTSVGSAWGPGGFLGPGSTSNGRAIPIRLAMIILIAAGVIYAIHASGFRFGVAIGG
jgi:hypothetical protein